MRAIILATLLALTGCFTDEPNTVRTLHAAGFTNVQTTGYEVWMCGKDDFYSTGFVATNPTGQRVKGAVCCGLVAKGCTIRF